MIDVGAATLQQDELGSQLSLLVAGDVRRHDAVGGVLCPLDSLRLDGADALIEGTNLGVVLLLNGRHVVRQVGVDALRALVGDLLGVPDAVDELFDFFGWQVRQIAAFTVQSPDAGEVVVALGLGATDDVVDQSASTASAFHGSGQVVPVLLWALGRDAAGSHDVLARCEGLGRRQRLVVALVFDALVRHVADVVPVAEDHANELVADRSGRAFRRWTGRQTAQTDLFRKPFERPFPGGVSVEQPANVVSAFGVHGDDARFATVDDLAVVHVAERRLERSAAARDLLLQPLHHLECEVVDVVLAHAGQHRVHELAGRRVVDVLHGRNQPRAMFAELLVEQHVLFVVAGKAVNLVDDDELDVMLFDVCQHLLELMPVGGFGRLTGVHELLNDGSADRFGLGVAGMALHR